MRTLVLLSLLVGGSAGAAQAVDDAELAKYWSRDALHVPYRALLTARPARGEHVPLVVFLHGDWQDGEDNEAQLDGYGNGSMQLIDQARKAGTPLLYIAPQTTDGYWPPERVAAAIRDAVHTFPVDTQRIVITGISDGGTGVWDTLKRYPKCFAAGVPMSGMTEPSGLRHIAQIPQWIFHGAEDDDTDIEWGYGGAQVGSRVIVRGLRAFGGAPKYTEYAGEKHVIWSRAYNEAELLPWILAQRLPYPGCFVRRDRQDD
ncbi:prolyl oligopeptidase family protein [Tahibacter aquaticus]|uniref:Prolyl oligopeptidase family protein n=1 Tax=Tahibacter aquaticus TaxID=520092 RepID=A0A4R6YI45_9GAMM|nr:prolyl oligopeptidase family protein [Tahibacter aquaticus]